MTVFVWGEVMILKFASLRTADAFPVVASLLGREATTGNASRSDDRKCVCCSQATNLREIRNKSTMKLALVCVLLNELSQGVA